jgi:putative NIF3 family GTP cyclohydrolase 1 type 2
MSKQQVVQLLNRLAPKVLAESWDNTGLLLESLTPNVTKIFLTLDLTPWTLQECLDKGANFIVSYHPIFFKAIKKLDIEHSKEIIQCLSNNISVYSPHTVLL